MRLKTSIKKNSLHLRFVGIILILFSISIGFINLLLSENITSIDKHRCELYSTKQNPMIAVNEEWYKIWGSSDNDYGNAIALDSSGNIYITGHINVESSTINSIFLLKYNITRNIEWNTTWFGGFSDYAYDIVVDEENSIYIVGHTYNYTGNEDFDVIFLKYNSSGNLLWNKTWGGINDDYGYGIDTDSSGNVYLSGYSVNNSQPADSDIVLIKFNKTGQYQWNQTWGGNSRDEGKKLIVDKTTNDIFITGYTRSFGLDNSYDILLLKYNSSGNFEWNKTYGGNEQEYGMSIELDSENNIYVAGKVKNYQTGNYDFGLVKYNTIGNYQWIRTWSGSDDDTALDITIDLNDNIYLTGYKETIGAGKSEMVSIKYDSSSNQKWVKEWGGTDDDAGRGISLNTLTGEIFFTGRTMSYGGGLYDVFLVAYSLTPGTNKIYSKKYRSF